MIRCLLALSLLAGLIGPHGIRADEDEDDAVVGVEVRQFRISEQSFDQMVFGGQQAQVVQQANGRALVVSIANQSNSADFRKRMESVAAAEIQTVDRSVSLTEAQKKKLQLAARGDIAQHISRAAELRPKLTAKPLDQQQYMELLRELQPLRMQQTGFLSDDSLFRKTLRTVLTDEQRIRFQALERERQAAIIETGLQNIERVANGLKLSGEIRRKFSEVILEHGHVPQNVGGYGQYIVLLEANLLRDRVRPLLTDDEWNKFEWQVGQAKRYLPTLESYGLWSERRLNDDDEAATDATKD